MKRTFRLPLYPYEGGEIAMTRNDDELACERLHRRARPPFERMQLDALTHAEWGERHISPARDALRQYPARKTILLDLSEISFRGLSLKVVALPRPRSFSGAHP